MIIYHVPPSGDRGYQWNLDDMILIPLKTLPVLSSDIIHVWIADLEKAMAHAEYFLSILSDDEKKKAIDYKFEKDKNRYIISRGILRELVSIYTGVQPGDIEFLYTEAGKPFFSGNTNSTLKFNLSHSGNFTIYAFSLGKEIGIDIEYIRNLENLNNLAKTTLSDLEFNEFIVSPEEKMLDVFFRYWIHKEAYLKAAGTGITDSIKSIEFIHDNGGKLNLADKECSDLNLNWNFHEIIPEKNYKAVLAVPDENCRIFINRLEDYYI